MSVFKSLYMALNQRYWCMGTMGRMSTENIKHSLTMYRGKRRDIQSSLVVVQVLHPFYLISSIVTWVDLTMSLVPVTTLQNKTWSIWISYQILTTAHTWNKSFYGFKCLYLGRPLAALEFYHPPQIRAKSSLKSVTVTTFHWCYHWILWCCNHFTFMGCSSLM